MSIDSAAAQRAIADFLRAIGHDPNGDPELAETPSRVVEAFTTDLLSGYSVDVEALLTTSGSVPAPSEASQLVVVRDLGISTVCPHHLMPALGRATVAYVPGRRVLGIGTLGALLDAYSRRLTLQETIGENVAAALITHAGAQGACCELTLTHTCMNARGTRPNEATVRTLARAGTLASPDAAAELALALGGAERRP